MNTLADMGGYYKFSHLIGDKWKRFYFVRPDQLISYLIDNGLYNRDCGNIRHG